MEVFGTFGNFGSAWSWSKEQSEAFLISKSLEACYTLGWDFAVNNQDCGSRDKIKLQYPEYSTSKSCSAFILWIILCIDQTERTLNQFFLSKLPIVVGDLH